MIPCYLFAYIIVSASVKELDIHTHTPEIPLNRKTKK